MYEDLLESLKLSTDINWQLLEAKKNLDANLDEGGYLGVCRLLLSRVEPTIFESRRQEALFDEFLIRQTNLNAFILVSNCLFNEKEASLKRDKYLDLVKKYVFEGTTLRNLLVAHCESKERQVPDRFETILMSLPERISNIYQLKTPSNCLPIPYFTHLCKILFDCLTEIHKRLQMEGKAANLAFLSSLSGRICTNGFSQIYWNQVLKPLALSCKEDFIWQRIAHRLVELQVDQNLESIVKTIVCFASTSQQVSFLLPNTMIDKREKLKFILTNKLLLVSYFENRLVLKNLIEYLVSSSKDAFFLALLNVLNAWSNSLSVKHRSQAQHLYLSYALVLSSKYLKQIDFTEYKQKYLSATMHGIQVYLKCPLMEIRNTGLFVGQLLMDLIQTEGPKLDFEIEETPDIQALKSFANENCHKNEDKDLSESQFSTTEKREKSFAEVGEEEQLDASAKANLDSDDDDERDDEVDEDDDLIPYDMSCDTPLQKMKKPLYLRDCMDGLIEQDKPEWTRICLESAAYVIRSNKEAVGEIAIEFTKILLFLDNTFGSDDFQHHKHSAMVTLCVAEPRLVAEYLTSQFYEQYNTISRRVEILDVLIESSQEISNPKKVKSMSDSMANLSIIPKEALVAEEQWKTIVKERLEQKTKIISSKASAPKASVNQFPPVSGYFFYPLMKSQSSITGSLSLHEEDDYVIGKIIYTLGIVLYSASQSWESRGMGQTLLDFLWAFRYHEDSFVRQAIIFSFCSTLYSVPGRHLVDHLQTQLLEFQQWLVDVTKTEGNTETTKKALQGLTLLKKLVDQYMS